MDVMLRNKIIASGVIVGILCLIFFTIIYPSKRKTFLNLKGEYTELDRTMSIARENLKQYSRLEREYDSLITTWKRIELLLPEEWEIPNLLEDIARVAERCGVVVSEFKPLGPIPQGFSTEIPIRFKLRSGYHQFGKFLSEISRLPRLLKVGQLNIKPLREKDSEIITLEADFIVSAYTVTKEISQAGGK